MGRESFEDGSEGHRPVPPSFAVHVACGFEGDVCDACPQPEQSEVPEPCGFKVSGAGRSELLDRFGFRGDAGNNMDGSVARRALCSAWASSSAAFSWSTFAASCICGQKVRLQLVTRPNHQCSELHMLCSLQPSKIWEPLTLMNIKQRQSHAQKHSTHRCPRLLVSS